MNTITPENIRTESIKNLYQPFGVSVDVLRLDLIHPAISGNKWFKLKFYLEKARDLNKKGILTFGGAYSNHIAATAEACRLSGLHSAAIIRGERPDEISHTLQNAEKAGMRLHYVSREDYRNKIIPETEDKDDWLIVDEGGYGDEGMRGAATIADLVTGKYDHVITAVGTGTTLAGLCTAFTGSGCIGISAMKKNLSLTEAVNNLLPHKLKDNFQLYHDFHFGGYAKWNAVLITFMNEWFHLTNIPTDFVYTGKMFYAADTMVRSGYFSMGARILTVHTGGLQGNYSLPKGTLIFDDLSG